MCTALGALREFVTPNVGWTAEPSVDSFAEMLRRAATDPSLREKGAAARAAYDASLTPEQSVRRLLGVYSDVARSNWESRRRTEAKMGTA